MDGRPTWTDCDEAGDYVVPNVLSPRDLVSRPDIMDETVPHTFLCSVFPRKGRFQFDNTCFYFIIFIAMFYKFCNRL